MVAYDRKLVVGSRAFDKFKKYFLKGMGYPKETKIRLFNSKAKGTIVAYTRIVKSYVRYTTFYFIRIYFIISIFVTSGT